MRVVRILYIPRIRGYIVNKKIIESGRRFHAAGVALESLLSIVRMMTTKHILSRMEHISL